MMTEEARGIKRSISNPSFNPKVITFKAGSVLIRSGSSPKWVYEVQTGAVLLRKRFSFRRQTTLDLLGKRALVGLLSVIGKNPYPFDIVALTRVKALRYSARHIDCLLKNTPDFARRAFRQMGTLLDRNAQTRRMVHYPIQIRIAYFLRHLQEALGPRAWINIKDMAVIMEMSVSQLAPGLSGLEKRSLVKRQGGKVCVRSSRLFELLDGLPISD